MATMGYEIDVQDVEYLRHGDRPLLARLFTPRGDGPFPMIVDLHGGAWCRGDRTNDAIMNEPLARSGVVVAALDFRHAARRVLPRLAGGHQLRHPLAQEPRDRRCAAARTRSGSWAPRAARTRRCCSR